MYQFTKWAFGNKAAIAFLTVLSIIVGIISYRSLPMEFLPAADEPLVMVVVMGQGTDSKTMEDLVTSPIENAVAGVKGKSNIYSTTGDGYTKIDIMFSSGTNMKDAKLEVQEAISSIDFPKNVSKPTIVQRNTSMIPIADVAVTFDEGLTPNNVELAKQKIIPKYKDIKGVANVQTYGASNSFVSVKVDNEKLAKHRVSFENVTTVLRGQNTAVSVGEKIIDEKSANIKVIGNIESLDKIKNLPVSQNVKLGDIAAVSVNKPENTLTRINGSDGLLLIVTKDSNSNAVTISKEVRNTSKEISKEFDNVQAKVVLATADMVETSVHSMIKEVLLGALFATIVIMIFLRNIRSTLITIVSIPLSLCLTLFLLSRSGITLNILTLGGVAVAVGRLVDDSIVVIENIFRRMAKETFSVQMIIDATKEVGKAITASTLTTVAVFLPIGLVSGGLQDFMMPFALTITYSLLASLLVALTVVPVMSAAFLKNSKLPEHKPAVRFTKFVTWSLNHKWVVLLLSILLFAGSIGTYFAMPKGAVDNSTSDFVMATLNYRSDTPIETVKEKTLELENFIEKQKGINYVITRLGISEDAAKFGEVGSPTMSTFMIFMDEKDQTDTVVNNINKQKDQYEGAELTAGAASLTGGSGTQITIDVVGEEIAELEVTADAIKQKIQGIDGIEEVSTNQDDKKTIYSLEMNPEKGNAEQVSQQLYAMLNRTPLGSVSIEDQTTEVFLEPMVEPKSADDLKNIPLMTQQGMVPASEIASLKEEEKPTNQFHKNGDTYVRVTAIVESDKLSEINKEINRIIFGDKETNGMKIMDGVHVLIGGASTQQAEDFTDLFTIMIVSIGLVFLIMIITFKSFRAPIAILCSLPLAAIGAVLGLVISRIPVDITALLGALMLIGIVVTNAIVLLDRVKQKEETMILRDAIVEAAATRMRPIIMTAVATICAMLPLLFKKAETGALVSQSLAVVVIGGLAIATMLTLVVIPVVYELLHFKKSKKQRMAKERKMDVA
ncbi:efflux RND transporter permease subunit [Peribacillus sp. SCS-155]|uniref:efflux RND transporter permease subunit n=1 Tax=Peribacillus sedimenti TaxID=3115297 RepID=UPI003906A592